MDKEAREGEEMERDEEEEEAEVEAPEVKTDYEVQVVAEFSGTRDVRSVYDGANPLQT